MDVSAWDSLKRGTGESRVLLLVEALKRKESQVLDSVDDSFSPEKLY